MRKKGDTVSCTAAEIEAMLARGEDRTDRARVAATTEEAIEADIAADPDWQDIPRDGYGRAEPGLPLPLPRETKRQVTLRLDPDILDYFKRDGRGWQSRINAVLRAFVQARERDQR